MNSKTKSSCMELYKAMKENIHLKDISEKDIIEFIETIIKEEDD